MKPGDARSPGPSTSEILLGDAIKPPPHLVEESYEFRGNADIPFSEFTSPAVAQAEHDHVWSRTWQWACREEHIPEAGDYAVYDIGDRSVVVVRGPDDSIKAFVNACLHRGTQLKPPGTVGFSPKLRCPFHGWTWSLDGELVDQPCEWDFPHLPTEEARLPEIRTGTWGGFVFVNFSDDAPSLSDYLGVLPDHFAEWDLANRFVEVHVRKRLPANWKASLEAFLEAYHVLETHSQAVEVVGDANTQYDVFGDHVSRFVQTIGFPSPHLPAGRTPDEVGILRRLMGRADVPEIPDGKRARDVYAEWVKHTYGERYDADLSRYSVSEAIDSIEYFLFPNAMFFPGLEIPMAYRFRPDGPDPDRCLFEVLFLRPRPSSGPTPPPAAPVDLEVDDSYTMVPGMPPGLGVVFDQDTVNLAAQTRGFKASAKGAQTLGNYQEVRIRHLHDTLRRYIVEGDALTPRPDPPR